ncbi:predicted protein [Histoplasma mississippiense (nom. inval.)]|nr:predicted protein [Histoplasma mississippiense (nom. inval.)]EDN04670.1 predicted protein [Histoplasma mississippiense (nom. inval.)]
MAGTIPKNHPPKLTKSLRMEDLASAAGFGPNPVLAD